MTALADRAPGTFTSAVVDLAVQVVERAGATCLLGPLRHLASSRPCSTASRFIADNAPYVK